MTRLMLSICYRYWRTQEYLTALQGDMAWADNCASMAREYHRKIVVLDMNERVGKMPT